MRPSKTGKISHLTFIGDFFSQKPYFWNIWLSGSILQLDFAKIEFPLHLDFILFYFLFYFNWVLLRWQWLMWLSFKKKIAKWNLTLSKLSYVYFFKKRKTILLKSSYWFPLVLFFPKKKGYSVLFVFALFLVLFSIS